MGLFQEDGALVLDFELELAISLNDRGFGDLEFLDDAVEAPAFGPEENETLLHFSITHNAADSPGDTWTKAVQVGNSLRKVNDSRPR